MKSITEWLDDNVNDEVNLDDDGSVEQYADFLRAEAEAAGYSADDLNRACGGDIAQFLSRRQTDAGDGKMAGDLSPILTPGFQQ
jgi:hypothetical protein